MLGHKLKMSPQKQQDTNTPQDALSLVAPHLRSNVFLLTMHLPPNRVLGYNFSTGKDTHSV